MIAHSNMMSLYIYPNTAVHFPLVTNSKGWVGLKRTKPDKTAHLVSYDPSNKLPWRPNFQTSTRLWSHPSLGYSRYIRLCNTLHVRMVSTELWCRSWPTPLWASTLQKPGLVSSSSTSSMVSSSISQFSSYFWQPSSGLLDERTSFECLQRLEKFPTCFPMVRVADNTPALIRCVVLVTVQNSPFIQKPPLPQSCIGCWCVWHCCSHDQQQRGRPKARRPMQVLATLFVLTCTCCPVCTWHPEPT